MKLRLTVEVDYKANGVSEAELSNMLLWAGQHMAGEGMFTGSTPAEVKRWTAKAFRVDGKNGTDIPLLMRETASALDVLAEDVEDAGFPNRAEGATALAMRLRSAANTATGLRS